MSELIIKAEFSHGLEGCQVDAFLGRKIVQSGAHIFFNLFAWIASRGAECRDPQFDAGKQFQDEPRVWAGIIRGKKALLPLQTEDLSRGPIPMLNQHLLILGLVKWNCRIAFFIDCIAEPRQDGFFVRSDSGWNPFPTYRVVTADAVPANQVSFATLQPLHLSRGHLEH
jgi:hypothetical protein